MKLNKKTNLGNQKQEIGETVYRNIKRQSRIVKYEINF